MVASLTERLYCRTSVYGYNLGLKCPRPDAPFISTKQNSGHQNAQTSYEQKHQDVYSDIQQNTDQDTYNERVQQNTQDNNKKTHQDTYSDRVQQDTQENNKQKDEETNHHQ